MAGMLMCLCGNFPYISGLTVLRLHTIFPQGRGRRLWREPPSLMLLWPTSLPGCAARKMNEFKICNVVGLCFVVSFFYYCELLWSFQYFCQETLADKNFRLSILFYNRLWQSCVIILFEDLLKYIALLVRSLYSSYLFYTFAFILEFNVMSLMYHLFRWNWSLLRFYHSYGFLIVAFIFNNRSFTLKFGNEIHWGAKFLI